MLVAWLVAAGPAPVSAQTTTTTTQPPSPADVECADYLVPEERKDPELLALRGVACFEAGEYLTALRHYREAKQLSNSNLLNAAIGRVFQELGYPFIARRYYRDYLDGPIDEGEGRQRIEQRLATVEEELGAKAKNVTVSSSPPEAEIFLVVDEHHWEDLGRTPLTVRLTPGSHRFVVRREGYLAQTRDVNVGPATNHPVVDAELVATDAAFGVSGRKLRRSGALAMAGSVPLIAAGTALFVVGSMKRADAQERDGDRRRELLDSGAKFQQSGAVLGVLGLATLATGGVLYWFGRPKEAPSGDEESAPEQVRIQPVIGLGQVGVSLRF